MTSQKLLEKYCDSALAVLKSQYEATKAVQHNATVGVIREQVIRDFLADHLPELISLVSGQIVDAQGSYSKQQDIVLILKSMPRLRFASNVDLIFQEGVVSTIEIKTTIDSAALSTIGENIASVRRLTPSVGASAALGITHSWPLHRILTAVVTFNGLAPNTLAPILATLPELAHPDLLLDLNRGLLVRNDGALLQKQTNHQYTWLDNPVRGFMYFLTFLTEITGTLSSRGVLWRNYW